MQKQISEAKRRWDKTLRHFLRRLNVELAKRVFDEKLYEALWEKNAKTNK